MPDEGSSQIDIQQGRELWLLVIRLSEWSCVMFLRGRECGIKQVGVRESLRLCQTRIHNSDLVLSATN